MVPNLSMEGRSHLTMDIRHDGQKCYPDCNQLSRQYGAEPEAVFLQPPLEPVGFNSTHPSALFNMWCNVVSMRQRETDGYTERESEAGSEGGRETALISKSTPTEQAGLKRFTSRSLSVGSFVKNVQREPSLRSFLSPILHSA